MDGFMKSQAVQENMPVYYTHKDRVFRLLFKNKKRLLELYNGLNGTNYNNEEELTVNTLENAIFIKMKNDLSFITAVCCILQWAESQKGRIYDETLRCL